MKFEKLGNIADIIAGQSPPSSTYNSEGNGIPFFQGKADYGEKYPTVRYWCTEPTKISLPDDILISMRAPVGPVNINTVESCIGRGLSAIRVKKNVSRDFVYFWLKQNQHIIAAKQTGSTFKAITQKILSEIVVPIPCYTDQLHIANLLSKAENLIAQRKESIRLLDEYLKSTFLEMFGDGKTNIKGFPIVKIEDISTEIKDGPHVSPKYSETGIPIFSSRNIKPGELVLEEIKYVSEEMYLELTKRFKPQRNDILVTKGGTTGFAKVVDFDFPFCIWVHIAAIRPSEKVVPIYLEHYVNSDYGYYQTQKNTKGAANRDLGLKKIAKIEMPLPPIALQTQFAQIVEKTETLKTQYQQSLQELENLYGSLSQKAFKGELNINDESLLMAAEPLTPNSPPPFHPVERL
jgi:type I restriction enzyme S subunit